MRPGYYWYRFTVDPDWQVVKLTPGYGRGPEVWFYGSEVELSLPEALQKGELGNRIPQKRRTTDV